MDEKNERTIKLSDFIEVARKCWIVVLAVALVLGVASVLYSVLTYEEEYTAKSELQIFRKTEDNTGEYGTGDYSVDLKLVNDIKYIIQSDKVISQVIAKINAEKSSTGYDGTFTQKKLKESITVSNPTDSRIIIIENVADSKKNAKIISDALFDISKKEIDDSIGSDRTSQLDKGRVNETPSNSKFSVMTVAIPFAGALCVYFVYFFMFVFDDKIKNAEDCRDYLDVSILGVIPNVNENGKIKGKYYSSYRYYSIKDGAEYGSETKEEE